MTLRKGIRKAVKWLAVTATLLLIVTWIASARWGVMRASSVPPGGARIVGIASGSLLYYRVWDGNVPSLSFAFRFNHFGTTTTDSVDWKISNLPETRYFPGFRCVSVIYDPRVVKGAPESKLFTSTHFGLEVPLWSLFIIACGLSVIAWLPELRALSRGRPGLCPHCRYDLAGTAISMPCPECGKVRAT